MIEREVKLEAPASMQVPDLASAVAGAVARRPVTRPMDTVYHDSSDLRLARWGYSLRHRQGEGWTLKVPAPGGDNGAMVRDEIVFPGDRSAVPAAALDVVAAYLRGAPVGVVAHLRTVRSTTEVRDAAGRRLALVEDDDVSVVDGGAVTMRFRELEVEAGDSPDSAAGVDALVSRLRDAGAGEPDPTPKLLRALGTRALAPPDVSVESLGSRATAGDAVRRAIAASVLRLLRHDPKVRLGGDPEAVHQARVATRRLRSDLRTFASLLDAAWATTLREELRRVAAALGTVRDAEVLLGRLERSAGRLRPADAAAAATILRMLQDEIDAGREQLLGVMRERRYTDLLEHLVAAAHSPALTPEAGQRATTVLPRLVRKPWRQMRRAHHAFDGEPTDEQLHDLRIRAKRTRYAAEAVAPVVGRRASNLAAAAAALQEVLGELHDGVVAAAWLREHAGRGGRAFAAGELALLELQAADVERARWAKAWKRLDRKSLTAWL